MAPSMVLLDRWIYFSYDEDAVSGGGSIRWPWEGRGDGPSDQEISDAVTEYLRTLKPQVVLADPPELSFLHILRPPKSVRIPEQLLDLTSAYISSADKNLVALYAGEHRPGSRLLGGYLIYDACREEDSFSVIPKLPFDHSHNRAIGYQSAVVMCCEATAGDDYFLAELVWVRSRGSEAELWLWKSSAQEWVLQPGSITLPSSDTSNFSADLCFSYRGSFLCWVDLLKGMVICDLDQNCKFSFVPLPQDCPAYDVYAPSAEAFRSMACVGGDIKFVALDGSDEHRPGKGLELTVWTLSPDLSGWNISAKYDVENIWANEAYKPVGRTKAAPSFPVLSIHEDGVIYLVLNDFRELERGLEYIGQSLLRVDVHNDKVQFYPQSSKCSVNSQLFASEFSMHRQRLQDRPVTTGKSL